MSQSTYIIGDIHGCSRTFSKMLFENLDIKKDDIIYLLGDYIDRGPRSKEVIDIIINLRESGYNIKSIMGNHEFMLLDSLYSTENLKNWYNNGCQATLDSFRVTHPVFLKEEYINFFSELPYYYILDDYIIVHGGLNFDIENPLEDKEAMLWTRNEEVDLAKTGYRKIIVGHTPVPPAKIKKSLGEDKIMLDGGCVYYGRYLDMGYLVALELNSMKLYEQINIDWD